MQPEGDQDPWLGTILGGRYRLDDVLGHGGMGSVYVARDTLLGRRYALKVLSPELAQDRSFVRRFLREAQVIAQLQHPNIVDIHTFGEDPSGIVFFTMELLEGEDLESRIAARSSRPYATRDACAWAIEVARAVAAVHDHGLIHRDLKTQNIFLARRREGEEIIKLLDFGIARPEEGSELTETGMALGTPSYMSPEQLNNEALDRRSDIYSFGVVLFKLLTGRLPFRGDPVQVGTQHVTAPVPVPSFVAPANDITPELDALILRAMAKKRDDRPASMSEVERALLAIYRRMESRPPSRGPSSPARTPPGSPGVRGAASTPAPIEPWSDEPTRVARVAAPRPGQASDRTAGGERRRRALDAGRAEITGVVVGSSNATHPAVAPVNRPLAPPRTGVRRWSWALIVQAILVGCVALVISLRISLRAEAPVEAISSPGSTPAPDANEPQMPDAPIDAANPRPAPSPSPPEEESPVTQIRAANPQTASSPPPGEEDGGTAPPPEKGRTSPSSPAKSKTRRPKQTAPAPKEPPPAVADPFTTTVDPWPEIHRRARKCRSRLDAEDSPKVVVFYGVGDEGVVLSATASSYTELGRCLASAVQAVRFEPRRRLGQSVAL